MLNQVKLTNFRQHENRTFTFLPGLNAIKGANESGKSTILLAVLYAMYGAKALPQPLSEMVTWDKGLKESDLKVELTMSPGGRLYKITRSKSGAECEYDGGLVTGQNEVTKFVSEILGADRDLACRLMMASQSKIRGALESGPTAVAEMIETLADFDLFDRITEAAEHKLATGPTASLEERVRNAEALSATLEVGQLDLSAYEARIKAEEGHIFGLQTKKVELEPLAQAAQTAYDNAAVQQRMRNTLEINLSRANELLALHQAQKNDADTKAAAKIDEAALADLKRQLSDASLYVQRQDVYRVYQALSATYPEAFWEGSKDHFTEAKLQAESERDGMAQLAQTHASDVKDIDRDIAILNARIVTASECPTCGADVSKNPKVQAKNEETLAAINALLVRRKILGEQQENSQKELGRLTDYTNQLKVVENSAKPFEAFAGSHAADIEIDSTVYPSRLSWRGEAPEGEALDVEQIRQRIVSQESAKEAAERANARSVALTETLKEDGEHVAQLKQQLNDYPKVEDPEILKEKACSISNDIAILKFGIEEYRTRINAIGMEKAEAEATHRVAAQQKEKAEADLVSARQELDTLIFNNTLMKKVRVARPRIADQLWGMVLASVSTMFSTIRGERSIITKTSDGFFVNGKSVTGLSGSALDALGLAIRVALIKTFLPHISFLCLDEPASACDEDRTASLIGFIHSSGFQQVLAVSHEEAMESAADHLIHL